MTIRKQITPKRRLVLSMHPYKRIEKHADGTGGGITLRVHGEEQEEHLVDVVWGESTEIEIIVDRP
jgi:hypothetical protein